MNLARVRADDDRARELCQSTRQGEGCQVPSAHAVPPQGGCGQSGDPRCTLDAGARVTKESVTVFRQSRGFMERGPPIVLSVFAKVYHRLKKKGIVNAPATQKLCHIAVGKTLVTVHDLEIHTAFLKLSIAFGSCDYPATSAVHNETDCGDASCSPEEGVRRRRVRLAKYPLEFLREGLWRHVLDELLHRRLGREGGDRCNGCQRSGLLDNLCQHVPRLVFHSTLRCLHLHDVKVCHWLLHANATYNKCLQLDLALSARRQYLEQAPRLYTLDLQDLAQELKFAVALVGDVVLERGHRGQAKCGLDHFGVRSMLVHVRLDSVRVVVAGN
mmetsp:Transcript_77206/g.214683  ORF Transcript_77206/g.214683 Transcript_77206/m.214683 type:complete len:329 (+) Transcript_77206:213-1199(+)